jgi:hypothetical protein
MAKLGEVLGVIIALLICAVVGTYLWVKDWPRWCKIYAVLITPLWLGVCHMMGWNAVCLMTSLTVGDVIVRSLVAGVLAIISLISAWLIDSYMEERSHA